MAQTSCVGDSTVAGTTSLAPNRHDVCVVWMNPAPVTTTIVPPAAAPREGASVCTLASSWSRNDTPLSEKCWPSLETRSVYSPCGTDGSVHDTTVADTHAAGDE